MVRQEPLRAGMVVEFDLDCTRRTVHGGPIAAASGKVEGAPPESARNADGDGSLMFCAPVAVTRVRQVERAVEAAPFPICG